MRQGITLNILYFPQYLYRPRAVANFTMMTKSCCESKNQVEMKEKIGDRMSIT